MNGCVVCRVNIPWTVGCCCVVLLVHYPLAPFQRRQFIVIVSSSKDSPRHWPATTDGQSLEIKIDFILSNGAAPCAPGMDFLPFEGCHGQERRGEKEAGLGWAGQKKTPGHFGLAWPFTHKAILLVYSASQLYWRWTNGQQCGLVHKKNNKNKQKYKSIGAWGLPRPTGKMPWMSDDQSSPRRRGGGEEGRRVTTWNCFVPCCQASRSHFAKIKEQPAEAVAG